jgi:dolichol-phosphate mannosyltransferase
MELTVVSPTFNEAANVAPLVEELGRALAGIDYEILIVDDDSPDRTWERVAEIGASNPRVRVLRRQSERGLARAVVAGFRDARGDAVACIDADLQHDPAVLPAMLAALRGGGDLVVATRYMQGGGTGEWNWVRRSGSQFITWITQRALRVRLRDPMSGYFMLRRADFLARCGGINPEGFKILLEIAATLRPQRIAEVPYTFRPRRAGESKLSARVMAQFLTQVWRLRKQAARSKP